MLPFDSTTRVLPLLLLMLAPAAAQDRVPPLPQLALDTYPVTARDAIARAHQDAAAHDTDAQAVGTLGRVLHAWEQWNAAHTAYTRAAALAPRTFDWPYLDAVVLQRLARPSDAVAAARNRAVDRSRQPAGPAETGGGIARCGGPREEWPAVRRADRPGVRACRAVRPRAHRRRAGPAGRGRHPLSTRHRPLPGVRLGPLRAGPLVSGPGSNRGRARGDGGARTYGARWPALPDPVLATVTSLREDAGALLQRGVKLADAGDVDGAIAAHEACARDRSVARTGTRQPDLALRAHAQLVEGGGALPGGRRAWRQRRRRAVQLRRPAWDAGAVGRGGRRVPQGARRSIRCTPQAHNNLGQILERSRKFEEAMGEYRRARREPARRSGSRASISDGC